MFNASFDRSQVILLVSEGLILSGFYRWYHVSVFSILQADDSPVQTYPGNIAYSFGRYSRLIQFQSKRGILQQVLARGFLNRQPRSVLTGKRWSGYTA